MYYSNHFLTSKMWSVSTHHDIRDTCGTNLNFFYSASISTLDHMRLVEGSSLKKSRLTA